MTRSKIILFADIYNDVIKYLLKDQDLFYEFADYMFVAERVASVDALVWRASF